MPVVTTAVKNHPSKRASLDWTALTQLSTSSCISVRIEGGTTRGLAEKRHHYPATLGRIGFRLLCHGSLSLITSPPAPPATGGGAALARPAPRPRRRRQACRRSRPRRAPTG